MESEHANSEAGVWLRLLGWVYLALFCALGTAGLYLGVLYSRVAPSWVMVLLAGMAVVAVLAGAKMAAWSHRRTASHERTRPPWWWFVLLAGVIMSGPLLGRLVSTVPVLTVLFMLGAAMGLGLAFFLIGHDWRRRRRPTES